MNTQTLNPTAAGDLTEWPTQTPASGEHWDKMADDSDSTYIGDGGTSGTYTTDLYTIGSATFANTDIIAKVRLYYRVKKVGGTSTSASKGAIKTGGIVYYSDVTTHTTSWVNAYYDWTQNPFTRRAWTAADIAALQIGVAATDSSAVGWAASSKVYLVVYSSTIGDEIKVRLDTISGLTTFAPADLPDTINQFPVMLILPGEIAYNAAFGNDADYSYRLVLLVTKQDTPSAASKLLDYVEPTGTYSIKAAIDGDRTLGGVVGACEVRKNLGLGSITWGGHVYLSTEFELLVWK